MEPTNVTKPPQQQPPPQQHVARRLAAILVADIAGYSRLMGADEEGTLARLKFLRRDLIDPTLKEHHGRIVKTTGDGILMEFPSVVDAVRCAVEVQHGMAERNADAPKERRIEFRIGINLGDVIVERRDLYGDGVNVAARLQQLAEPGSICLSGTVYEHVRSKVPFGFDDLGEQRVKNIAAPVRVYRPRRAPAAAVPKTAAVGRGAALPAKPSIAVLPFTNMSGDAEQEYFADGVAEDIITALSRLRGFFVIARNSSFTYKGKAVEVRGVARELGVQYVLEGSVRKAGGRVRVTAQLIEALDDKHLWAERYDRDLSDVFAIQDEITASVVASIEPQLYQAECARSQHRPTQDMRAWDYAIRALSHLWRWTERENHVAQKLLETAAAYDPDYAFAHSLTAWAHTMRVSMGWAEDPAGALDAARASARRAVALDAEDAWAHFVLGYSHVAARQSEEAIAELQEAVRLNSSCAVARAFLGLAHAYAGQPEAGIPHVEEAVRVSPRDPMMAVYSAIYGTAEFVAGRYEAALRWGRKALRERPDFVAAHRCVIIALAQLGALDEAKRALAELKRHQPRISLDWAERFSLYARAEDRARYVAALRMAGLE